MNKIEHIIYCIIYGKYFNIMLFNDNEKTNGNMAFYIKFSPNTLMIYYIFIIYIVFDFFYFENTVRYKKNTCINITLKLLTNKYVRI